MDRTHGAPVMAVHTKTAPETKTVFIYPAKDPGDKTARKLWGSDSISSAYFAFGVPLRTLNLKLPVNRRFILPHNVLEVPGEGTVYYVTFCEFEKELRNIDAEAAAAAKKAKKAVAASAATPKQ